MHKKSLPPEEEQEFNENAEGQLTIPGLDTPLGTAANAYLEADKEVSSANDALEQAKKEVLTQMDKIGKNTFKFEGKIFTQIHKGIPDPVLRVSSRN